MYFSKTIIIRLVMCAAVVVCLWTVWKRVDAIIDNYQAYYNIALIQKIWREEQSRFDAEFNKRFDKFDSLWFGGSGGSKESSIPGGNNNQKTLTEEDKKWEEYQKNAPFPAENKPVPAVADEYTKGYYHGLWNFFITSGFASIFAAIILIVVGVFSFRFIWTKITDQLVNKIFAKFM